MWNGTMLFARRIRLAGRRYVGGLFSALLLCLAIPQGSLALALIANPDWDITVTEFGYSDLLIYNAGPFPAGFLHEMLSGEWAAAIGYDGLGTPEAAMWLEPMLLYPNWLTNSTFNVVTPLTDLMDSDGDGLPEWYSVISNGTVEIAILLDMEDTVTGTPMGLRNGNFVLSNRYVLRQTYRVTNVGTAPLENLRFYQMLHGHPANTEAGTVEEVYDPDAHPGALANFRYDITQYVDSSGAPNGQPTSMNFRDHVGVHSEVLPDRWGLGHYRGHGFAKPVDADVDGDGDGDGLHYEIERDSLEGELSYGPDEVAGAMRRDHANSLAGGASVEFEFMLSVRSETYDDSPGDDTQGPTLSIDLQGPSIGLPDSFSATLIEQGHILTTAPPGAPGPNPALPGPLPSPGLVAAAPYPASTQAIPELDALSYGRDHGGSLLFSVDEFAVGVSTGGAVPDVASEGSSGAAEASADVFSYLGPVVFTPDRSPIGNEQFYDGDGLPAGGAPGFGLLEPNAASFGQPDEGDNLDAFDNDTKLADLVGPLYFSLDAAFTDPLEGPPVNSGSAALFGVSPADVLVSISGGPPSVAIPAASLGLDLQGPGTDDLDALIFDDADGSQSLTANDRILFSVRRGSALVGMYDSVLGVPIVEGDVLAPPGAIGATPGIYVPAEALGLFVSRGNPEPSDDLDALDLPEPGSSLGLLSGGGLLLWLRRRRGLASRKG